MPPNPLTTFYFKPGVILVKQCEHKYGPQASSILCPVGGVYFPVVNNFYISSIVCLTPGLCLGFVKASVGFHLPMMWHGRVASPKFTHSLMLIHYTSEPTQAPYPHSLPRHGVRSSSRASAGKRGSTKEILPAHVPYPGALPLPYPGTLV